MVSPSPPGHSYLAPSTKTLLSKKSPPPSRLPDQKTCIKGNTCQQSTQALSSSSSHLDSPSFFSYAPPYPLPLNNRSTQPYNPASTLAPYNHHSPSSWMNATATQQSYATTITEATSVLRPPRPSYVPSHSRSSSGRPDSIASFSAYSILSNEPLQQSKSKKSTTLQKLYSFRKGSSANTTSNLTLKDSIAMSTTNHLNHDGRTTNPSGPSSSSMPVNTASRRSVDSTTRSSISSTTRRGSSWKKRWDEIRPRKYRPQDYKLKGFGRVTQFSNERLYLHWIRFGVLQAGIAVTLLSFGIGIAAWVGMGLLVLALLTLIYATQLFHKRHLYLVSKRKDIKYFARVIPTLLTFGLFALYACNFALTMHYGEEVRSPLPWAKKDEYNFGDMF